MATGVTSLTGGSTSQTTATAASPAAAGTQSMFLQLLVAQLQNQDPTNPMDTTNMVTQLAEVQQLQETMGLSQNVSSILQDLNQMTGNTGTASSTTAASSGS